MPNPTGLSTVESLALPRAGADVLGLELSIPGGDGNWHNRFGQQFGTFLKNQSCTCCVTQPLF